MFKLIKLEFKNNKLLYLLLIPLLLFLNIINFVNQESVFFKTFVMLFVLLAISIGPLLIITSFYSEKWMIYLSFPLSKDKQYFVKVFTPIFVNLIFFFLLLFIQSNLKFKEMYIGSIFNNPIDNFYLFLFTLNFLTVILGLVIVNLMLLFKYFKNLLVKSSFVIVSILFFGYILLFSTTLYYRVNKGPLWLVLSLALDTVLYLIGNYLYNRLEV